ncbi:hypothetical protein A7X64_03745 [Stenotrophomonas maltophilia]|uniref:hypothetical protein n=1 Tax=Stenotrophomonas maltophilia TaxID=40324 RepID=UPI000DAA050B|nr:hypothetical protein [Stenotrophomonas maltophilia]PZS56086.1 hypothetical protein A7X64_03745 [Stenotrophomonas maltophilia]PZS72672.1 hypothetical protein A7X76_06465 [Stenotrophomonas maltophilia]
MSRPTALFVLLIVAPLAAAASSDPRDVVTRLYDAIQAPTSNETTVSPLLGEALRSAIAGQRAYEQACTALAAPDEKPHMLDQSPYLLAPDRPETISVGMPGSSGDATWIHVDMAVGDYRWTDRVLLQRQDRDWKVMDIRWGQGGNLIGRLKAFSAFRCTPSGSWPGATR